jgi:hypothetical protein
MNQYTQVRTYIEALAFRVLPMPERSPAEGLGDDRGLTMEQIVIIGASALGAAAVSITLWATLKGGADDVGVPVPQSP